MAITASMDSTLLNLQNSSYPTKAIFNDNFPCSVANQYKMFCTERLCLKVQPGLTLLYSILNEKVSHF